MRRTIAVGSLALGLLLHACTQATEPTMHTVNLSPNCAQSLHLTIVGDSLARGWGASSPQHNLAGLLYAKLQKAHRKTTLENLGIPGATTDEIAAKELAHVKRGTCALVVVISGANDVQKLYTPAHFRRSYATLLRGIRSRAPRAAIVVLGLPNIALSRLIPPVLKPLESSLARSDNAAIAHAARAYGAVFVPLYELSESNAARADALISSDGIHPNDAGYRLIASATLPYIAKVTKQ